LSYGPLVRPVGHRDDDSRAWYHEGTLEVFDRGGRMHAKSARATGLPRSVLSASARTLRSFTEALEEGNRELHDVRR